MAMQSPEQCLAARGVFIGGRLEKKSCPWRNSFSFYFIFTGIFRQPFFVHRIFFLGGHTKASILLPMNTAYAAVP